MLERLVSTIIGGTAGALLYLAWQLSKILPSGQSFEHPIGEPLKWFVVGGMLLGLIGGLSPARWLWSLAIDDVRDESKFTIAMGLFMILLLVLLAIAFKSST